MSVTTFHQRCLHSPHNPQCHCQYHRFVDILSCIQRPFYFCWLCRVVHTMIGNIPTSSICYWLAECFSSITFTDHTIDEVVVFPEKRLISLKSFFQMSHPSRRIVLVIRKCYIRIPEWQWYLIIFIHQFSFIIYFLKKFFVFK